MDSPVRSATAARADKAALRAELQQLEAKLRAAQAEKREGIRSLVALCRAERREIRALLRDKRAEALRQLEDDMRAARAAARLACETRLAEARKRADSDIARARAALAAQREHADEVRRINHEHRRRQADVHRTHDLTARTMALHSAILGRFGAALERVTAQVKPMPGESRAEAVLRHVQTKPEHAHAAIEPTLHRAIEQTKRQIEQTKGALRTMPQTKSASRRTSSPAAKASAPLVPSAVASSAPSPKPSSEPAIATTAQPASGSLPVPGPDDVASVERFRLRLAEGRHARYAVRVRFKDGRVVAFSEPLPKRSAIAQAIEQLRLHPEAFPRVGTASTAKLTTGSTATRRRGKPKAKRRAAPRKPIAQRTKPQPSGPARKAAIALKSIDVRSSIVPQTPAAANEVGGPNVTGRPAAPTSEPRPVPSPPAKKARTQETVKAPEVKDTAELAKLIREDIKAATKARKLPNAKYSVTTSKYSMGSSITVAVSRLPFRVLNADAFVLEKGHATFDREHHRSRFTPEADKLRQKLEEIVGAYHWDKSDLQTDYHHSRFHYDIRIDDRGEWEAINKKLLAAKEGAKPGAHAAPPSLKLPAAAAPVKPHGSAHAAPAPKVQTTSGGQAPPPSPARGKRRSAAARTANLFPSSEPKQEDLFTAGSPKLAASPTESHTSTSNRFVQGDRVRWSRTFLQKGRSIDPKWYEEHKDERGTVDSIQRDGDVLVLWDGADTTTVHPPDRLALAETRSLGSPSPEAKP